MNEQIYYFAHLSRALLCLRQGYPENAVSWMWRDIGEMVEDPGEVPDPKTLRETVDYCGKPAIAYRAVKDTVEMCGEGI